VQLARKLAVLSGKAGSWSPYEHNRLNQLPNPNGNPLAIPDNIRERIFALGHHAEVAAHPGMIRMYSTMQRRSYWPSIADLQKMADAECMVAVDWGDILE